jgi:hypothetical protein
MRLIPDRPALPGSAPHRLGLAGYHISNGGLDRPNYGAEALVLFLALPVRR